ncbi:MAG: hypothetical protein ACR2M3_03885 [Thermomicrobiales bacterium]
MRDLLEAYDFTTARAALIEHFERCAAWLNHAAPHSTHVETSDPHALTLRVGTRAYFTFHETADGSAYAWWYPASPRPVSDHDIVGDAAPVVHEALLQYMRRARSELG